MGRIKQELMPLIGIATMIPILIIGGIGSAIINIHKGLDFLIDLWSEHLLIFLFATLLFSSILTTIFLSIFDIFLQIYNWVGLHLTLWGTISLFIWICFLATFFSYRFTKATSNKTSTDISTNYTRRDTMSIENNHIIYNIEINNLFLSHEIVCRLPINKIIDKVSLFPSGGNSFKLDLTISPGHSYELLSNPGYQNMLDTIIGNIALTTNSYIGPLGLPTYNLQNRKNAQSIFRVCGATPSPPETIASLRESIEKNKPLSEHKKIYVSALCINDTGARFIFLYSILSLVIGDAQQDVEKFIKQTEPAVEIKDTSLRGATGSHSGKKETIYTFLRNALAHSNKNLSVSEITQDMLNNINGLAIIVREAVER